MGAHWGTMGGHGQPIGHGRPIGSPWWGHLKAHGGPWESHLEVHGLPWGANMPWGPMGGHNINKLPINRMLVINTHEHKVDGGC